MADTKYPPLLKNTPFVGSASNRVVHRTDSNCPRALEISPNERWYIKDIPHDGNYLMCPFCFPQPKDEDETEGQPVEVSPPAKARRKAVPKTDSEGAASPRPTAKKAAAPRSRATGGRASTAPKKKSPKK